MNKVILKIGGMSCSACSNHIEKFVSKQKGIIDCNVNLVMAQAMITYDDTITIKDIEKYIKDSGYKSLGLYDKADENKQSNSKTILIVMGLVGLILMYISMGSMIGLPSIDMMKYPIIYGSLLVILTIPFLVYGFDIIKSGIKNIWYRSPNMDTLVSIGVITSLFYSLYCLTMVYLGHYRYIHNLYFESVAMVIYFVKLGRYIDSLSKDKTKNAISELVQITPQSAFIKRKEEVIEVTIDEVKVGDILICKPGMKVSVDGVIVEGEAYLDEAFITGESIPAKKSVKDRVVAGSVNQDGYFEYKAERIGKDSTISEIVRLVMEATNTKAPISRIADIACSYFVPVIILIALVTFIGYLLLGFNFSEAINSFVTVLVVACPCALGLATPLAIVVAEGLCARNGILVKSSEILENSHKVDTIVFDKTGTLTYGDLRISKVFNYSKYTDNELLELVSVLENKSTHPIGKAFSTYYKKDNFKVVDFKNIAGIGLYGVVNKKDVYVGNNKLFDKLKIKNTAETDEETLVNAGNSIVYVIENHKVIGLIGVKDIIRDDAKDTITELKSLGKDIIMLTGDNNKTASIIGASLEIDTIISDVLPAKKTEIIKSLLNDGKNVMMVGDGINDAPSLVSASIGVSINSGADIAIDSANVILMNNSLEKIVTLIKISRKTVKNIKQNLFWAFFYNILMIPVAMGLLKGFGIHINPMMASIAMTISSLTVIFNALRIKKIKI